MHKQVKNIFEAIIRGPQKVLLVNFLGRGSTNRQIEVLQQQNEIKRLGADETLEFDPGSGRTLAACLKHASRTNDVFCTKGF